MKNQAATCADAVLGNVRELLKAQPKVSVSLGHQWPRSSKGLRNRILRHAGSFWDNVTYTETIDMRQFNIPNVKDVKFTFVDPVYVWLEHANSLHEQGHQLVWHPQNLKHPETGEHLFGAGVEYGLLFRAAKESIPLEAFLALINLSWDGGDTGYTSRSASPICAQVVNKLVLRSGI